MSGAGHLDVIGHLGETIAIVEKSQDGSKKSCVNADVAQLVERNLAKVEVAGSSPVIRSMAKQ